MVDGFSGSSFTRRNAIIEELPERPGRAALAWRDLADGAHKSWMWTALALQDIKLRYRGSVLGPWWLSITTSVMAMTISLVYAHLFSMSAAIYRARVVAHDAPEARKGEQPGNLLQVDGGPPVALPGQGQDGVRADRDVAADHGREVYAQERQLRIRHRVDEVLDDFVLRIRQPKNTRRGTARCGSPVAL
jgi:hypothetical protein